ncbi:MAG: ATP-binding cassette domain-containing protein [Clostridium sp.]|nr:ATP-binding cassette domain-containing protein [Clostridium sp.]
MLEVTNVSKCYDALTVLKDLSLSIGDHEILALTGPSGCGKTTLLNLISNLETPDSGSIRCGAGRISYMFQNARLLPWRTVYDNIRIVRGDAAPEEVEKLIAAVGLQGFENYYPSQLSGGMAKRCALARAFHYKGDLLLMDEPFQGLDYGLRMEMLSLVLKIRQESKPAVLFVTHEIDEALTIADSVAVLSDRPSAVKKVFRLPGENGRDCTDPGLTPIRREIHSMVSHTQQ